MSDKTMDLTLDLVFSEVSTQTPDKKNDIPIANLALLGAMFKLFALGDVGRQLVTNCLTGTLLGGTWSVPDGPMAHQVSVHLN